MGHDGRAAGRESFYPATVAADRRSGSGSPAVLRVPECDARQTGAAWSVR